MGHTLHEYRVTLLLYHTGFNLQKMECSKRMYSNGLRLLRPIRLAEYTAWGPLIFFSWPVVIKLFWQ